MVKGGADAEDGRTTPCKLTAAASSSSSSGSTGHGDVAAAAVASGGGGHHHGDAWMAPTALFHHCFCCSLLTGAVLTGVYATVISFLSVRLLLASLSGCRRLYPGLYSILLRLTVLYRTPSPLPSRGADF